jgi:hypothetical protein
MQKIMKDNEAFTRLELIKERIMAFIDAEDLEKATEFSL